MCVPSLGWTLNGCSICRHWLVDIKYLTVCFVKSRQDVAGTMAKFQIPAISYKGHCISSTAMLMMLPRSLVLHKTKILKGLPQNFTINTIRIYKQCPSQVTMSALLSKHQLNSSPSIKLFSPPCKAQVWCVGDAKQCGMELHGTKQQKLKICRDRDSFLPTSLICQSLPLLCPSTMPLVRLLHPLSFYSYFLIRTMFSLLHELRLCIQK